MGQPVMITWHYIIRYKANWGKWNISVPQGKEIKRDFLSSGERKGRSPKVVYVAVEHTGKCEETGWYSRTRLCIDDDTRVGRDTWYPVWIWGDHPPRLNTTWRPIVNQYREGKAKRTLVKGVKESLKPCAYKQWELLGVTAYLLYNGSASCLY